MVQTGKGRCSTTAGWIVIAAVGVSLACERAIRSTRSKPLAPAELAQLWYEPRGDRDLFWGVGGKRLAPDPAARYRVVDIKRGGFSRGYDVVGPNDREWSVKFPPEGYTEVVASRIHWAIGYHQPPIYHVAEWLADDAPAPNPQLPARFREDEPELNGLDTDDTWSYYENPFVGTRHLKALLALQVMLGNSDLKDDNNRLYTLDSPLEGSRRWYVARDVGQSFGRTGVIDAPRGDVEVFEQTPFIRGIVDGQVQFEYRGRHAALLENITPADVRWLCDRLAALTDEQWTDAFRAGGYAKPVADRFIRRMKQKIAEGRALKD